MCYLTAEWVAECTNRILDKGVTSLLSDAHFPARFGGEALSCFLHTLNLSPSSAVKGKTPYEAFYNQKLSPTSVSSAAGPMPMCRRTTTLLIPSPGSVSPVNYKGWKCWEPSTGDVFISCDVCFVETEMPSAELELPGPSYEPIVEGLVLYQDYIRFLLSCP